MNGRFEQIDLSELQNKKNSDLSTQHFTSSSFHYLRYFFNVGFYTLLVPFRIVDRKGKYYFQVNKIQQGVTLVLMILAGILAVSSFRLFSFVQVKEKPDGLFTVALLATNVVFIFCAMYVLFLKRDSVSTILSICQNDYKTTSPGISLKGKLLVALVCILFGWFQSVWLINKNLIIGKSTVWTETKTRAILHQYNFFITNNLTAIPDENITPVYISLIALTYVLDIYWRYVVSFMFIFLFICATALVVISKEFNQYFDKVEQENISPPSKFDKISFQFRQTCDLISAMNEMAGPILVIFLLEAVPYFAMNVITIFDSPDILSRIQTAVFFAYYFLILIVAAEGNSKLRTFNSRLFRWSRAIEDENMRQKIMCLAMEASEQDLGLDGGGFFFVTYEFVGAVTSLYITYATIMLSFK